MPIPLAGLALGLGAPMLSYMHGKSKGQKDPSKGGLGGALASAALLNPLSGIAYGMGHKAGREKAVSNTMDAMFSGMPVTDVTLRQQDMQSDPRGRLIEAIMDTRQQNQMRLNQALGVPFNPMM
tara:strand:- start:379 stop:750 length:372 start_codon:yes stop_codon:yes gene_type:complete